MIDCPKMRSMPTGDFAPRTYACTALAVFFDPRQDLRIGTATAHETMTESNVAKTYGNFIVKALVVFGLQGWDKHCLHKFSQHVLLTWLPPIYSMSQHMRRTEMRHLESGRRSNTANSCEGLFRNLSKSQAGALSQACSVRSLAFCIEYSEACSHFDIFHKMLSTSNISGFLLSQATAPLLSTTKTSGSFQ